MDNNYQQTLYTFIVKAKAASYVGGGQHVASCRPESHDLEFKDGDWSYLDSYYGGRDFIGEEVVYHKGKAVWAMNYYGRILREDLITPEQAGHMIKASLARMYAEGHFLGGHQYRESEFAYVDTSKGDVDHFTGRETISREGILAYELVYHGGAIKNE
jgi:hypothetical protein